MRLIPFFFKSNICNADEWIKKCEKFDLISLDIYGTSLIRLVSSPEDVFYAVECCSGIKGFAEHRIKAQEAAMRAFGVSANIYHIYDELRKQLGVSKEEAEKLIRIEIVEEKNCSIANAAVIELIQDCKKKGKKLVFTSDMYLPSELLAEILSENGLTGYDELIISCEYGLSKGKGDLFQFVYEKYRNICKRFIHIGDGRKTDFLNAWFSGRFSSAHVRIARENAYERLFMYGNIDHSVVYKWSFDNMGGLMYAFCQWIEDELNAGKYNRAVFLTREGAYIKGFFDQFYTGDCETDVFYVSRRAIVPAMADFDWEEFMYFLKGTSCRIAEFADIFSFQKEEVESVAKEYRMDEKIPIIAQTNHKEFLDRFRQQIESYAHEQRKMLIAYMKQMGLKGEVALVDIGWRGTMQADLQKIVDHEGLDIHFTGLYLGEYDVEGISCKKRGFLCSEDEPFCIADVVNATYFFENALLMPIGTTKRYHEKNGRIVPELASKEKKMDHRIKTIQSAMEASFALINRYRGYISFDANSVVRQMFRTINNPTYSLACELGDIPWYDLDTVRYIAKPDAFVTYIRSPQKILLDMRKSGMNSAFFRRLFKLPLPYFAIYKKLKKEAGTR